MQKKAFAVCAAAAAAVALALALAHAQGPNAGLADRARAVGRDIRVVSAAHTPVFKNLEELAAASTVVAVGTAGENVCRLSPDGSTVTTDYQVTLQEVMKGRPLAPAGSTITVSLPGGKAGVPDPATGRTLHAEVRVPWFRRLESGKRYYLFLTGPAANGVAPAAAYKPTGGPQGIFEDAGATVITHSGRLRDPIWRYHRMDAAAFKADIYRVTTPSTPAATGAPGP